MRLSARVTGLAGVASLAGLLGFGGTAHAGHRHVAEADSAPSSDDQVIVVNAANTNDTGQIARMHRVLDQRGMLFHLTDSLEETLEGRNVLLADLDSIKNAYAGADYEAALKLIDEDEQRLLEHSGGDIVASLSMLAGWRGLIAAAMDRNSEAQRQFRAAIRLNPAWSMDRRLPSPRVRSMIVKAHRELEDTGVLEADTDPADATITIDGNDQKDPGSRVRLPIGIHLVQITAEARKPYSELVDITPDRPYKLEVALEAEGVLDKAAKLVDESAAAPSGRARLKRAKGLSRLTGHGRILFIEDADRDHIKIRLYDVDHKRVSRALTLDGNESSSTIASAIGSALDPDNLVDVNTIVLRSDVPAPRDEPRWYNRWYVWAGAAAILGGAYLSYDYATREPTSLRGF